jgi:hypothetical protein
MSVSVVALQPELQLNSGTPSGDDSSLDRTANWLLPALEEMTFGGRYCLLLHHKVPEDVDGCPHNVFTQHTLQLTVAHTAGNLCLQFLYLLSVRTRLLEHHLFIVCYMFRPCLAIIR